MDKDADKFSNQKLEGINPAGFRIKGGIGYETKDTFQQSARANKSGDGTVPYCSLNYVTYWEKLSKEEDIPLKNVHIVEIEGAEHREMLIDPIVTFQILNKVCKKVK